MTKFRLDKYQIDAVSVESNENFNTAISSHTGDLKTGLSVGAHKTDRNRYLLILEVLVQPKKGKEDVFFPYSVRVKGRGAFVFSGKVSFSEVDHVLRTNGAAILYGMFRGQVNQITSQSSHGPFLLPVANFIEMYECYVEDSKKTSKALKKSSSKKSS